MAENSIIKADSVEGRPSVFVYEAASGVIFHIRPVNAATRQAMNTRVAAELPFPDKTAYQIPDPEDVAFTPGQASRAEDNPEYIAECNRILRQRNSLLARRIFEYAVSMPKYPSREALVQAFKPQLDKLKAISTFAEDDEDYDIVLINLVMSGKSDYDTIISAAIQETPLAPAEVAQGIRMFRVDLQRA